MKNQTITQEHAFSDNKIKYLEMIQDVIKRMADNSFTIKKWLITLIAGAFVFSMSQNSKKSFILLALLLIISFWILDTYYLQLERRFRNLYNETLLVKSNKIDFSMKIAPIYAFQNTTWLSCMFSISEVGFYMPILCASILLFLSI